MAFVHHTTLTPTKLDLLTSWLPSRPWYVNTGRQPDLAKAGGFRLDDPEGEVGIEFMVVVDSSGNRPTSYLTPMSYRGAPLAGAGDALIGTTEHGVLGKRWVYDGPHDPVVVAQLLALLQGTAQPQQQSISNTPDPSVVSTFSTLSGISVAGPAEVTEQDNATELSFRGAATVRVLRVLEAGGNAPEGSRAQVTAGWTVGGADVRAAFAVLAA